MIRIRHAAERGGTRLDWLDSRHTFSFGGYVDPGWMGFRGLRVLNDDRVAPGGGFPTHPHRDMEILTYVLSGALEHADSMGNRSVIRAGDLQRMTAGSGVTHSEFNPSATEPVHFLQIWIVPEERGLQPRYEQAAVRGSVDLRVHRDARFSITRLAAGEEIEREIAAGRHAWIHVARGSVRLGEETLSEGDGVGVSGEPTIRLRSESGTELLLFDLA